MAHPQALVPKPEIACVALFLLGGHQQYVHTEDVAMLCNELAPGRFQWERHPEQISLDKVRNALRDAKKLAHGGLVMGGSTSGWMLTEAGLRCASARAGNVRTSDQSGSALTPKDAGRQRRERERLLCTPGFQKCSGSGGDGLTLQDAEGFFRVDDYVIGPARERKIVRVLNTFSDDPEIGPVAALLAELLRQKGSCS